MQGIKEIIINSSVIQERSEGLYYIYYNSFY